MGVIFMFNKSQASVYCPLGYETQLIVGHFIRKILKCLLFRVYSCHIKIDGLKHFVIGNSSFYNIIQFIFIHAFATPTHEIEPFVVISIEYFNSHLFIRSVFENMETGIFPCSQKSVCVFISLLLKSRHIESFPKIEGISGMFDIRRNKTPVGGVVN